MATTSKCEGAIHGPHSRKQIMIERKRSISKETPILSVPKRRKLRLEINYNNFDYHRSYFKLFRAPNYYD